MITFNTPEEFDAYDAELAMRHNEYMRSIGYDGVTNINPRTGKPFPVYECTAVFGTPEPNEDGKYVITDEMLDRFPHLKEIT